MIAAMANYMDYSVYDLELTIVKDNNDLRKLLIETTSKSIIILEDIDCSLDLTGKWSKPKKTTEDEENDVPKPPADESGEKEGNIKVTLSRLLNFIDGLWSACGREWLIIITTNHIDNLDPPLIRRRGRMDNHIEMSYCGYEALKVLAHNYLAIENGYPLLFEAIERLMGEAEITPADITENLIPKSPDDDPETCLCDLIRALEMAKEEGEKILEDEWPVEEVVV